MKNLLVSILNAMMVGVVISTVRNTFIDIYFISIVVGLSIAFYVAHTQSSDFLSFGTKHSFFVRVAIILVLGAIVMALSPKLSMKNFANLLLVYAGFEIVFSSILRLSREPTRR